MRTTTNVISRLNPFGRHQLLRKSIVAMVALVLGVYAFAPPVAADPATVPDAPTITGVTMGHNSVTLDFDAGADGGDPITQFTVTCASSDGGTTKTATDTDSPITVSALSNGKTYNCTVVATNGVGDSAASDPSDDFVAITIPDAPTISGYTLGNNSATVSFSANGDGGDEIFSFKVTCTSTTGGTTKTKTGLTSPLTVTSLSNARTYTCSVVANNSIGASAASAPTSSFVAGTTPPAPSISGVTRGNDSANVAITSNGNAGSALTSYDATCTSSDGGATQTGSNGSSPVTVSSLTDGKTYTCTATVTNFFGSSPASVASSSFVAALTPDAPTLTGVTRGQNAVDVAFTANGTGGDPITSYTATCTSSDGGTTRHTTGAASPLTVITLSNGKTYACTVVATNGVGDSPASSASGDFVAATVADAPTMVGVTRGTNSAVVAFTSNFDGSDTVTSYTATCASSDGGATRTGSGSASPVTVSALANGKTYSCTVVATNEIGDSAASAASDDFTAAAVPSAPTIDTLTRDDNAAIVAFTPGSDGGDTILTFTVTCTSSDGGTTRSVTDTDSPITVSFLSNSKTYSCTVFATNSIGDGAASTASADFVAATVPNAPSLSSITRTPNAVSVAFTSNGNAGDTITDYTVTCTSSDGGATRSADDSTSPITVDTLGNGKTYSCAVVATNSFGDSAPSDDSDDFVAATLPDAPDITGRTAGNNSVSVAFTANADGGDTVTSFTATCASSDGGTTHSHTNATSPVLVTGLTNGKTYTCTVVATNEIGDSDASDPSASFVAVGAADPPSITSVDLSGTSVTVAFDPGADGGQVITGYTVTCASSDGGTTKTGTDTDSPITVSALSSGKTYSCTVVASNGIGDSDPSSATGDFVADAVPDAPTVTGVTRGSNSAIVAFTANGDGGDVITDYKATCTSSNGGVTRSRMGTDSPLTVSSLTNARTYTCKVVAINGIGTSAASVASSSFVASTYPSAPTLTGITRQTNNAASVTFTANATGGAAITGFTVTCTSSDGGTTRSNSGGSSPVVVSTLTNGKTYTCSVVATNPVGDSPASADSSAIVAVTSPSAPTIGSLVQASNAVDVAFTANADGGSAVTHFDATCTSSDGGTTRSASGASSPLTVTTLTNAHTYTCAVTATNAFGTSSASADSVSFTAGDVPAAPTIGVATRGTNSASVAFTANGSGGNAITGFTVTCTSSDGGTTRSNTGASSPIVVSTLTNAKTYTCAAVATNISGNSVPSAATASFVAAAAPSAPVITTVTRGQNSAIVAFTDTANGDAITTHLVTCTSSNSGVTKTASGATSPITVAALTNAKTYTCALTATNTFGTSPASAASTSFIAATVAGAPTIGTVTHSSGTAIVAFTAPVSNGGSAITLYTATCTSSNGGATKTGTKTSSGISVAALTVGKTYTCKVFATNAIGDGASSAASASFVA